MRQWDGKHHQLLHVGSDPKASIKIDILKEAGGPMVGHLSFLLHVVLPHEENGSGINLHRISHVPPPTLMSHKVPLGCSMLITDSSCMPVNNTL